MITITERFFLNNMKYTTSLSGIGGDIDIYPIAENQYDDSVYLEDTKDWRDYWSNGFNYLPKNN